MPIRNNITDSSLMRVCFPSRKSGGKPTCLTERRFRSSSRYRVCFLLLAFCFLLAALYHLPPNFSSAQGTSQPTPSPNPSPSPSASPSPSPSPSPTPVTGLHQWEI